MAPGDDSPAAKGNHPRVILFGVAVLAVFGIAVFWILRSVRSQVDARLASSLQTVLATTDRALRNWVEQAEADVLVIANSDGLRGNVEAQLRVAQNARALRLNPALASIRDALKPAMQFYQIPGFAVMAPSGLQIAGESEAAVGTRDLADHNPKLVSEALAGKAGLGLPYKSPLFADSTGRELPVMPIAAPIRDEAGKVIAVLALIFDPRRDFTNTTEIARFEITGETYLFDHTGRLLSESRFDDVLRRTGLIQPDQESILNLQLRDPGGNILEGYRLGSLPDQRPLTLMAESATKGHSGINLEGYRDYRGVLVIGAWLWDHELGIGLATEMDRAEALGAYRRGRDLVWSLLFLMIGVSILLLLILRHRERLLAANQAYREAVNAREDMMAIVAHDLKNPLNSMLLRAHIMMQITEKFEGEESRNIRHNLELLRRTARHMNQLIGDLTDAAKIHAGRLHLDQKVCRLQNAMEPAIERARLLCYEKGIEFTADVGSDVQSLLLDERRVTQVMDNLLGNALKFTPRGGKLRVQAIAFEHEVRISVADAGPGIPPEALSRIFEPYWQERRTRSGMGLGLFIARTIIEGHHGRISVDSSPGHGTTFHFTLPFIHKTAGGIIDAA